MHVFRFPKDSTFFGLLPVLVESLVFLHGESFFRLLVFGIRGEFLEWHRPPAVSPVFADEELVLLFVGLLELQDRFVGFALVAVLFVDEAGELQGSVRSEVHVCKDGWRGSEDVAVGTLYFAVCLNRAWARGISGRKRGASEPSTPANPFALLARILC